MYFYLNPKLGVEWTAVLVPSSSNENEIIFMTIDYSDPDRKPTSRYSYVLKLETCFVVDLVNGL